MKGELLTRSCYPDYGVVMLDKLIPRVLRIAERWFGHLQVAGGLSGKARIPSLARMVDAQSA